MNDTPTIRFRRNRHVWMYVMLCIALWFASPVHANLAHSGRLPVFLRVDREGVVQTTLFLKCSYLKHDMPFTTYRKEPPDQAGKVLVQLVDNMASKRPDKCAELVSSKQFPNKDDMANLILRARKASSLFDGSQPGISARTMHIAKQYFAGNRSIFIWGVDTGFSRDGKSPFRSALIFEVAADGRVCWDGAQLFDPLTMLLLAYERNIAQQGEVAPVGKNLEPDYSLVMPGTAQGSSVELQFNATPYDFDLFNSPAPSSSDRLLLFYWAAFRTLELQGPESLARFYTPESETRWLDNWNRQTATFRHDYKDQVIKAGRRVRFIMHADPLHIVFYTAGPLDSLLYDYVIEDVESGEIRLTNYFFFTALDDVFSQPSSQTQLRQLFIAGGSPQSVEK
jgi:hypothetical protein